MGSVELVEATPEVLEPGQRSLQELADEANREHKLSLIGAEAMVEHAIQSGLALLNAKQQCEEGQWGRWLDENWQSASITARLYMRLARYQNEIRASGSTSMLAARRHLVMIEAPLAPKREGKPTWVKQQAIDLYAEGLSQSEVARRVGLSLGTVHEWLRPDLAGPRRQRKREADKERRAQRHAEQERAYALKVRRVARKAGGAIAEAYAMAERMQDTIAQAHREATDPEAREALSLSGEHYRKMRDQIVRALGVS